MELTRIKVRVRAAVGWSEESDLTTARLEEAINYIYTRKIPGKLKWAGYQQWVYVDLADGDNGKYPFSTKILGASGGSALGDRVISLNTPILMLIDDDTTKSMDHTYDFMGFFRKWLPYANEPTNQPVEVLEKDRILWVRPLPDDTYVLKIWANVTPVALENPTDEPLGGDWGETVIAGAVALLMEDDEEGDTQGWWTLFDIRFKEIARLNPKPLRRVPPRW